MKNKRPSKFEKGGLYIALCCFALIAAVIGYAGRKDENTEENIPKTTNSIEIASDTDITSVEKSNIADEVIIEIKDEEDTAKVSTNTQETETSSTTAKEENIAVSKTVEASEPEFSAPVKGKTIIGFSGDNLLYNEILSDWRTHNGIDITCDENAAIYAAADGVVEEIYETSQGKTVRIDHNNGFKTVYSNLSEQIEIISGDELKCGDLIGKVGNSSVADFTNEPHLHFEIILNGEYVNPEEYIK